MRLMTTVFLAMCLATVAARADEPTDTQPDRWRLTGQTVELPPADPRSMRILAIRLKTPPDSISVLGGQARIYLPADGQVDRTWGLIVWISPANEDELPATYLRVFKRLRLIVISPLDAGNSVPTAGRLSLAVRCADYAARTYRFERRRLYVSGFSGGGRCASWLGVLLPEMYRGAMPICGCDYFRPIPVPGSPGKFWKTDFRRPTRSVLDQAKKNVRFVLLTSEHDDNRQQTRTTCTAGFMPDGFQHVTYLEAPEKAHEMPLAGWLERGIRALDGK